MTPRGGNAADALKALRVHLYDEVKKTNEECHELMSQPDPDFFAVNALVERSITLSEISTYLAKQLESPLNLKEN